MTGKFFLTVSIVAIALMSTAPLCQAQQGDASGGSGLRGKRMQPQQGKRAPGQRIMDTLLSVGVKQQTAEKLVEEFKALREQRRALAEKEMALLEKLSKLLEAERVDRKKLRKLLNKVEKLRMEKIKTMETEFSLMKKYLSKEQHARMLVERYRNMKRYGAQDRRGERDGRRSPGMRPGRLGGSQEQDKPMFPLNPDLRK